MYFDALDEAMRSFETQSDRYVRADAYVVARVDGRSFTRLTRETRPFAAPFDPRFRDLMLATARHLLVSGFRAVFAHTHSDEISVLLHREETSFGRKERKWLSILAGEASARFSASLGHPAAFDCRLSVLPDEERVVDYFRWRQEDARRNARNAHAYWLLRAEGRSQADATAALEGLSIEAKDALLGERGPAFDELPLWQRHGVGLWWERQERTARDPRTGAPAVALRRRLHVALELPGGDDYGRLVAARIGEAGGPGLAGRGG